MKAFSSLLLSRSLNCIATAPIHKAGEFLLHPDLRKITQQSSELLQSHNLMNCRQIQIPRTARLGCEQQLLGGDI